MDKIISLENVSKSYGSNRAVDHLSLAIGKGEFCVLIGPSGCGKTTCAKMINRLIEPDEGQVFLNGADVKELSPQLLRRQIGYVIQSVGLFPHLTVQANIAVVPDLLGWEKNRIAARVKEMLEMVSLEPARFKDKYPRELSGGEAQRVGVARALAADPMILIMDEPFGAVDPLTREKLHLEFLNIQKQLRKTIVFITHFIDEAIRLADKIAIMRSGQIVQYDTTQNILAKPADSFVREFIGTDRALKRLLKLVVKDYFKPVRSFKLSQDPALLQEYMGERGFVWVTDDDTKLVGWLSSAAYVAGASLESQVTHIDPALVAINSEATLNEALSRMLEQGIKTVPVVDQQLRFMGDISLEDVAVMK